MNFFKPETLDLAVRTGCGPLSDTEAHKLADHLAARMDRTPPEGQFAARRLIFALCDFPAPEAQYGDLYTPSWYVPGWQADA